MEDLLPPLQPEDSIIAGLCYPFWFVIAWMVLLSEKKKEPFVKFHALQATFFGLITTLATLLLTLLLYFFFKLIPPGSPLGMGFFVILIILLVTVVFLALTALIFYFAFKALNGEFFRIFLIAELVEKFFPPAQEA